MCAQMTFVNESGDLRLGPMIIEVPYSLVRTIQGLIEVLERMPPIQKAYPARVKNHLHLRTRLHDEHNGRRYIIGWHNSGDPKDYPGMLDTHFYLNYFMMEQLGLITRQDFDSVIRFLQEHCPTIDLHKARPDRTSLRFDDVDCYDQETVIHSLAERLTHTAHRPVPEIPGAA